MSDAVEPRHTFLRGFAALLGPVDDLRDNYNAACVKFYVKRSLVAREVVNGSSDLGSGETPCDLLPKGPAVAGADAGGCGRGWV